MKNLTFEFQEYDKVININVEMVLFFKKKLSNIEVILHIPVGLYQSSPFRLYGTFILIFSGLSLGCTT